MMKAPVISPITLPCPAEKLLTHRPPMLLINKLLTRQGDRATASANLSRNNVCFSEKSGILPEYFVEIVAQTMAAANGYDALALNSMPGGGFIVGIDNCTIFQIPQAAQLPEDPDFTVKIVRKMAVSNMKVVEGEVFHADSLVAVVELKVWDQPPEDSQ